MIRKIVVALLFATAVSCYSGSSAQAQGCGPSNPNCIVPTVPTCVSDNRAASTAYVTACGGGGGGVVQPFTTAPGTLTTNGQGTWGAQTANGLVLGGQGSSTDIVLENKTGATVCNVATGTTALTCTSLTLTTALAIAQGGTGATTQQGALNAVAPGPTRPGDLIQWNGANWVDFPGNNTGTQCLTENSAGVPAWANCATGGGGTPGGSTTQVQYNNAGAFGGITNLTSNGTNTFLTAIAAPATPAAGFGVIYEDSTNKVLALKNDAGTVSSTVVPASAPANQFSTGISAAGVVSFAQPTYQNLGGSPTFALLAAGAYGAL